MSSSAVKCPQCGKPAEGRGGGEGATDGFDDDVTDLSSSKGATASEPESIFMCPGCGAFIVSSAVKCPQCGIAIEDSEEAPADEPAAHAVHPIDASAQKTENQVLALCMACGAFSIEGLERCPSCNALMSQAVKPDKPSLPKEDVELLDMLVSSEPQIPGARQMQAPRGGAFAYGVAICGVCGAFVKPGSERCGVCATLMNEETIKYTDGPEVLPEVRPYTPDVTGVIKSVLQVKGSPETLPPAVFDETNIDVCTVCGAFMQKGSAKCPVCNSDRSEMPAYEPLNLEMESAPAVKALVVCPRCGSFAREGEGSCSKCGAALPAELPRFEGKDRDTLSDAENVLIQMLGANELEDAAHEEPKGSELDICVNCGAFMSAKTSKCPMCGAGAGSDVDELFRMLKTEDEGEAMPRGSSECPFCGAHVDSRSTTCGECGFVFAQDIKSQLVPEKELEEMENELETLDFMADGLLEDDLGGLLDDGRKKDTIVDSKINPSERDQELDDLHLEKPSKKKGKDIVPPKSSQPADVESELDGLEQMLVETEPEQPVTGAEAPVSEPAAKGRLPENAVVGGIELQMLDEIESGGSLDDIVEEVKEGAAPLATKRVDVGSAALDTEIEDAISEIESAMGEMPEPEEAEASEDDEIPSSVLELERELDGTQPPGIGPEAQAQPNPETGAVTAIQEIAVSGDAFSAEEINENAAPLANPDEETFQEAHPQPEYQPEEEPGKAGESFLSAVSEDIPAWKEPVLLNLLIFFTGMLLCIFLVTSFLFPNMLQIVLIALFQPVVIVAYAFSRGVNGLAALERRSSRWIAPFAVSASLFPLTAIVADSSALLFTALFAVALALSGFGTYAAPKGWRKRALWAASAVTLFTFAGLKISDAGAISTQAMLGVTMTLLGAACVEAMADYASHKSLDLAIARGDSRYSRSDYARAVQAYDDAIVHMRSRATRQGEKANQGYDLPWSRKGVALVLSGDVEEGVRCLEMALKINPENAMTWINLGNALTKMGRHSDAVAAFDKAIERDPKQEVAWNNKGNSLARQGKYMDALKSYNSAIKLNPNYQDVWINKGYVLAKLGKFDEAARCVSAVKSQRSPSRA
ncbi:MAG: tetratricopeptide repeat protein [Methanobacteriota archaeon]